MLIRPIDYFLLVRFAIAAASAAYVAWDETFIKALWKQGVGSTIHCVAGDATGIILAAVITATLGLPMWIDLIVEYATGFAFGLFIFQSLFMKSMMGGRTGRTCARASCQSASA